jgi:integrase
LRFRARLTSLSSLSIRSPSFHLAAVSSWADPGLVFPNTKGKIRRRDSVMRSLRRFLEEAGLPVEIRFHDLRHTAGTLALQQGVPLHTVSRMLGHSDPAMTLKGGTPTSSKTCARTLLGRWTSSFKPRICRFGRRQIGHIHDKLICDGRAKPHPAGFIGAF